MRELAVPILPSRDLAETLDFYEPLGFESLGTHPDGAGPEEWIYLILHRGDVMLHFYAEPDVDPLSTASSCYVYVDDVEALHAAWADLVVPDPTTGSRVVAPFETDYGLREFAVVDRSGNLIRLGSPA